MRVLRRSVPGKLLEVESFSDHRLSGALIRYQDCAFLYTGGGMVPETLLGAAGLRILHIHPGWVPELRGSDGMLWSSLLRSELTASLFYMSSGIDEGELIARASAPLPRVDFGELLDRRWTEAQIYSALLATVDPHLRGLLLVSLLREFQDRDLRSVPSHPQPKWNGPHLLWMHPEIRRLAYYHWDSHVKYGMNSGLTTSSLTVEFSDPA